MTTARPGPPAITADGLPERPLPTLATPAARWWVPRDARSTAPRVAGPAGGGAGRPADGLAGIPAAGLGDALAGLLPASRWLQQRCWHAQRAEALKQVVQQIDAARGAGGAWGAGGNLGAWLAITRAQRQRAAARGDARLDAATRPAALACAALLMEPVLGHAVPAALLDAALALGDGGAVELHTARERQLTLALAGAVAAWSGRPCHLIAGSDDMAAASARSLAPLWAACGLHAAALAADTAPRASQAAYRADIVHASARRLAADLSRDRRLRASGAAQNNLNPGNTPGQPPGGDPHPGHMIGPLISLTRGQYAALLDDLDRVLIDDALSPLVLSVEHDPTALLAAIQAAAGIADQLRPGIDWHTAADGAIAITAAGETRLATLAAPLPALWRTPARRGLLVQQALFVRDQLRPGIDYQVSPGGQPMFDDRLGERLPDRDWMTGILQALQVRLGLPPTPITRTAERGSLQTFFAGYHQLGGTAPCLDGLAAELWRCHGLLTARPHPDARGEAPAPPVCVATAAAQQAAVRAAVAAPAALLVLRRPADGLAWGPLQQPGAVALALESTGPVMAVHALGFSAGAVSSVHPRLQLVMPEPLDSARAETAFLRRTADASGAPVAVVRLLHPQARALQDPLGAWGTLAERLCNTLPALAPQLLPPLLGLARWRLNRQHVHQRLALLQRERQLQQQLSFAGTATPTSAVGKTGPTPTPTQTAQAPATPLPPLPLRSTGPG